MKFNIDVDNCVSDYPLDAKIIFKSPWSSSGRGVFVSSDGMDGQTESRLRNFLRMQGGFVSDQYYDKQLDFALEYYVNADGTVFFCGYSVFMAVDNGKYGYNLVDSQERLRNLIDNAVAGGNGQDENRVLVTDNIINKLIEYNRKELAKRLGGRYYGPVGIDMLVANEQGRTVIHPCVEINLRMNMGILAIYLFRFFERLLPECFPPLSDEDVSDTLNTKSPILVPLTPIRMHGFNTRLEKGRFMLSFS